MWTGALSVRRAVVLWRHLPATSRTAVAMRGGADHDGWDVHAYLLAGVIDAVNSVTHATAQVHSKRKLRRPDPLPRPGGASRAARRTVTVAQLARTQST